MRTAIIVFVTFSLAGCLADERKQMAACKIKALQTYPNDTLAGGSPSRRLAEFEQTCMRAEGYNYTCEYDNLSDWSMCYEPSDPLDRLMHRAEQWLKDHRFRN